MPVDQRPDNSTQQGNQRTQRYQYIVEGSIGASSIGKRGNGVGQMKHVLPQPGDKFIEWLDINVVYRIGLRNDLVRAQQDIL